jgi:hypothetical protein
MASKRYEAKHAFGVEFEGAFITIPEKTVVSTGSKDGAKLLKQLGKAGVEEHFKEFEGFGPWDVEQATAGPGEKRGA